ncbi:MAG: hydrogenobyrinic acid a,c-diamide synthase (glutamine-hydrolyzing) [bacterium]|nr:hydrogenobyrinic acid a,c-diamide synthase (glutamine-hydrolyzing) [bacterium]
MTGIFPRITIAGMAGDSGKTLVTTSILSELLRRHKKTAAFKKGPDFIDAAWLSLASRTVARNLDTFIMGPEYVLSSFISNAVTDGFNIIEGNRGLFDGTETGENSTAELAKLLKSPVVLICSPVKVTRTAAALIMGCKLFDKDVNIAGIILNRIAGKRHESVVKRAIEETCGIPVIGAIPKFGQDAVLPDRHLGLVTPEEMDKSSEKIDTLADICRDHIDIDELMRISSDVPKLEPASCEEKSKNIPSIVKIGYFCDSAFTFYYPENLEALRKKGAELIKVSAINDTSLPDIDALYIGGGFPETHMIEIEKNSALRNSVKNAAESGMPVYAECGGLIYLSRSIRWKGRKHSMADVFPVHMEMHDKPQGHGYSIIEVDNDNPFFPKGIVYKGHEFHYSSIIQEHENIETAFSVKRGTGCFNKRDGLIYKNVLAGYTHLHESGAAGWSDAMVDAARKFKSRI